ncbi:hypothetical protein QQP08_006222 [Theobroma cacao]|uniref:Uncharacterized protein n=1 Tax=Theobroma cacao TaxID=3641 RepID=A0A061DZI4_THECC|nr:Uncharacterized protein TCM_006500 [Theobroma cacao]WRX13735.1 hypothetical protein QQP08_006222 [Theobroma cacao]
MQTIVEESSKQWSIGSPEAACSIIRFRVMGQRDNSWGTGLVVAVFVCPFFLCAAPALVLPFGKGKKPMMIPEQKECRP